MFDPSMLLSLFGPNMAQAAPMMGMLPKPDIAGSFSALPQAHTGGVGEIPGLEPNLGPSLSTLLSQGAGSGGVMPTPPGLSPALMTEFARNPDKIAAEAAKAGIPPPPLPQGPSIGESLEPSVGAAGVPLPRPRPEGIPEDPATITSAALHAQGKNPQLEALKGLKAPVAPPGQKVSTPSAQLPRPGDIKSGELMALLASLGMGGAGGGAGGMKLPQTLGAALGGR
jgi:hypothetical protein